MHMACFESLKLRIINAYMRMNMYVYIHTRLLQSYVNSLEIADYVSRLCVHAHIYIYTTGIIQKCRICV